MKKLFTSFALCACAVFSIAQDGPVPEVHIKKEVFKMQTPGEYQVMISITCNNATVNSFASYKEDLDSMGGEVEVTSINTGGANFSYVDGKVKFLWSSLNLHGTMVISYLVQDNAEWDIDQPGTFKYVYNNAVAEVKIKKEDIVYPR